MKKLIGLVVLAAAAYAVYAFVLRPPEKRACNRMAELCGIKLEGTDADRCVAALGAVKKTNPAALDKVASCVAEAKSCGEAAGCASGMALNLGAGFLGDFLTGMQKSLK